MSEYLKYFSQQLNFEYPKIKITEEYFFINHYGGESEKVFLGYQAETKFNGKKYIIKSKESREDAEYLLCKEIIDKEDLVIKMLMQLTNKF